jgi:hypothetical protein
MSCTPWTLCTKCPGLGVAKTPGRASCQAAKHRLCNRISCIAGVPALAKTVPITPDPFGQIINAKNILDRMELTIF